MSKRKAIEAIGIGPGTGPDGVGARLYILALGTGNRMFYKYWDGKAWKPSQTDWESLGNSRFVSPPVATLRGATSFDVVALGTDNQMYHKYWDGSAWHPSQTGDWDALGGVFVSPPALTGFLAAYWKATSALNIFGIGTNNQMYYKSLVGGAWQPSQTGWTALGGVFVSAPAATNLDVAGNQINAFALGTDNQMYQFYWDGSKWNQNALGGVFVSAPAASSVNNIQMDIVGLGTDNQMYHSTGASWEGLGGTFASVPAIVETGTPVNTVDVFALGSDNQMYHKSKGLSGSWQPDWTALGGVFNSAPAGAWVNLSATGDSQAHVVAIDTKNEMQHKYFDGTSWHPSLTGWEALGGTFTIP